MTDYRRMGEFWMAPGEAIDLYIDLSYMDYLASYTRNTDKPEVPVKPLYTEGSIYDCINNLPLDNELEKIRLTAGNPSPKIYSLTAEEMTERIINEYKEAVKRVEAMDSHPLARKIKLAELKVSCIDGINRADGSRYYSYRMANPDLRADEITFTPDRITDKQRESVFDMVDFKDPLLMINNRNTAFALMKLDINDADRFGKLRYIQPTRANFEIAENGVLTDEQLQEMRKWDEPFFYNMMQDIQNTILKRLANESDRIQKTPDVPLEELFKTIVAPHKGKVVMVDFWNTWCGPCRQALGLTEPLKSGELADENLVWIYIANETSPISQYLEMIPDIKGLHYRLNDEQWKQLTDKDFDIDGIPSYVLVKKDGSYSLRNDLRNHDKFINTLKTELK
jgi:thiol-disulfide isomerase/thioredoxin